MDHYVKVEEETRKQNKLLESSWITLLCEWQATLLGMKCQCKDLMESENQGFLLGGGQKSQATMKENKKKLGLLEVKPYSEFFKNTSCEYVL